MSFMPAPAPFDDTPRDLNTASFPAHLAANDAAGEGWLRQYLISASVKFRDTKVGLVDGTAEMSSIYSVSKERATH